MAIKIIEQTEESITWIDFVNYCDKTIQAYKPDTLLACSKHLKMLSNNKTFLRDFIYQDIYKNPETIQTKNQFGNPLGIIVHTSENYYVRVTLWPKIMNAQEEKPLVKAIYAEEEGVGHDHNFWLMTVGYIGSGYQTELWEYNHASVIGYLGEKVNLKFIEKTILKKGDILVYRPSLDVHQQGVPKESYSIAINIILKSKERLTNPFYGFDLTKKEIVFIVKLHQDQPIYTLISMMGKMQSKENRACLEEISKSHISPEVRIACYQAIADPLSLSKQVEIWENALKDKNIKVQYIAKNNLQRAISLC